MAEGDGAAGGPDGGAGTDRAVDPKGNQRAVLEADAACVSVDAGAGTGKTTTMLLHIERAIESGAVDPEDVLVLTFANEAAASIREDVAALLDPEAAAAIDVSTYHSFCHRLVREYAYYLGFSPEFDVVTDRRRRRIVTRLLAENDYGFAAVTGSDGTPADLAGDVTAFVEHVSRENVDPETLAERLPEVRTLELLAEFVLWLEREAGDSLTFDSEALRYFNREEHLEDARAALVDFGKLLTYCREKVAEAPAAFRDDAVVRDADRYFRVLQSCVTNTVEALSLEESTTKHLPRALFANRIRGETTGRIEQTPIGRLASYVEFLRLARHYADVYADYRAHLERERTVDFDELVRTATRLLEDGTDAADSGPEGANGDGSDAAGSDGSPTGGVADEITDRWAQVYCDEFQDTDETQFDLIAELTRGPDRPDLLAIGDKDQAIYGWRGTDREGLDRLADVHADHERIDLELNFRSKQEILDLTNRCDYGPQSSKTLREHGRTPGEYDEPEPPTRVARIDTDALSLSTPEGVGTTVARLLNGAVEGVPERSLGDLAVVVRTNRHARAVADELRDRRIPFEISGSTGGDRSPGVRTVLSYLRALVDPTADVHLRRVLLVRYRLPEDDLERLHARDGSLFDAVLEADAATFSAPDRLERAREHLRELAAIRNAAPIGRFFRRFREITRVEWYLTEAEREDVERIERLLASSDPDAVLETLDSATVDALERAITGGSDGYGRGERSADRVDVMTVHQAKGLQFDTVLVPFLSDEEWCVERDYAERARYRMLSATLDEAVDSPLCADLGADSLAEEWRVLHVALTRARNHLFLFGSSYDYEGEPDELGVSTAADCLADAIEWRVDGVRMDLWETLTESFERVRETYPETVVDRTADLERTADVTPGTITYYAGYEDRDVEPLETRAAVETVHDLGRLLRDGTLLPAADAVSHGGDAASGVRTPTGRRTGALSPETVRFPVETLASADELPVALRHSYTAVRTREQCARKHYLDHVVRAVDDPAVANVGAGSGAGGEREANDGGSADGGSSAAGNARLVGSLFHDVAEEAFHRDYRSRAAWREAAERQLTARDLLERREAVLACVDRYFEAAAPGIDAPLAEWERLAAELPFVLSDVDGVDGEVVGYVDAVCRTPAGDLVVLDYKATADRIAPAAATQLRLYLRACEDRFAEPISRAGYAYVGEAGPRVDLFDRDDLPPWASVADSLEAVDDPSFDETTPGEHCRTCPHRSLGCAPDEFAVDLEDAVGDAGDGTNDSIG